MQLHLPSLPIASSCRTVAPLQTQLRLCDRHNWLSPCECTRSALNAPPRQWQAAHGNTLNPVVRKGESLPRQCHCLHSCKICSNLFEVVMYTLRGSEASALP